MKQANYAENQERWDRGEVSLEACYKKGQEHRAYGFSCKGLGFHKAIPTPEQQKEYERGYNGQ